MRSYFFCLHDKTVTSSPVSVPEGLVDGPVPADESHRGEEDEPEDGQTEVNTICCVCSEVSQACQHVEEKSGTVD